MKQLILSLFLLLSLSVSASDNIEQDWDRANTLYVNEQYDKAIAIYDSLYNLDNTSHKLLYNLANAHFKQSNIAEAILYYNKALKLAPTDEDTKHNLMIANTYVKDNIEVVPEFFLNTWMRSVRQSLTSNAWATLGLIFFAIALILILFYLLSRNYTRRKLGFFGALLFMFISMSSLVFSNKQRNDLRRPNSAVIMSNDVAIKSSPNKSSTDIFILNEGTVVRVLQRMGEWYEVSIADGNKGWLENSKIEMI